MKFRFVLLIAVAALTLGVGCTKKNPTPKAATLEGSWHLKNIKGGLMGINQDYVLGDVTWHFNAINKELSVTNTLQPSDPKSGFVFYQTGTYAYQDSTQNGALVLFIDGQRAGTVTVTQNELQLDEGITSDGFLLTFAR